MLGGACGSFKGWMQDLVVMVSHGALGRNKE